MHAGLQTKNCTTPKTTGFFDLFRAHQIDATGKFIPGMGRPYNFDGLKSEVSLVPNFLNYNSALNFE